MYPKVNQNIMIELTNSDQSCKSIVAEIRENEILIGVPLDRRMVGLLLEGTKINVHYLTDENQYMFHTEIIAKTKDIIPLFRIVKPKENEIIRVQRRENFRMPTNLRFHFREHEFYTINISAGGMLFSCQSSVELQVGYEISGTLFVPNQQNKVVYRINIQGEIKRIDSSTIEDRKNVAIEFTVMNQRDQMKITQYCFEKQLQNRLS
ncbi:type IV pilus assembly PilZ [Neobacillus massiliamazoniensis]|uniref:Type IV pilus assembly PilZ n=1 Tax=Neobacillus massiliamazoniensis TaxID=1499688 RepID=A0A0U1NSA6_9BACI|nr:type IV pilus assembly PilZ [Neobacillus massiliamazoniensis]